MTLIRLGYVAMSLNVKNASPSQTMTFTQFRSLEDRQAAIRKLEEIAKSNLNNCLRLLKHNHAHDIHFFRFSSRLIPLANHEALTDWRYLSPLKDSLSSVGDYIRQRGMRVDFHPDHFVLLNSPKKEVLKTSIRTLNLHAALLKGMGIDSRHRCVLHIGGKYNDKEKALEQFIHNWMYVPEHLQSMVMLENDDTSFTLEDTLYLSEKLGIPLVFDLHHHLANHRDSNWESHWKRVVRTWKHASLPMKMHISSPKSGKQFRHHADYIDPDMFLQFLRGVSGSVPQIDCMIEAKGKDNALFKLVDDLKKYPEIKVIDGANLYIKNS